MRKIMVIRILYVVCMECPHTMAFTMVFTTAHETHQVYSCFVSLCSLLRALPMW